MNHSGCFFNTNADLVFDDDIPKVVCKITHGNHVPFLLRVLGVTGTFRYELQLVLDPLESSETSLTPILVYQAENTYSYKLSRRLSSSTLFAAFPSTPSRSNRARTDSILFLTGDVCKYVIRHLQSCICSLT